MNKVDWIKVSLDPIIKIATSGIIEIDDDSSTIEGITQYRIMFTFVNDPHEALTLSKLESDSIDHSRCWGGSIYKRKGEKGYWTFSWN
jgi:hypothetical protein